MNIIPIGMSSKMQYFPSRLHCCSEKRESNVVKFQPKIDAIIVTIRIVVIEVVTSFVWVFIVG